MRRYIFKQFRGQGRKQRMAREACFYSLLKRIGFKVPNIFYQGESFWCWRIWAASAYWTISWPWRLGMPVGPDLFRLTCSPVFYACSYMGDFNRSLYYVTGKSYILGDVNFRNFLLGPDGVYRVDLEDCRQGRVEEDLGRFIAFFLTYQPAYTEWKQSQCRMIKEYCRDNLDVDMGLVETEIERELIQMKKRRKSN
ncbi:MAG: hypothetical protein U5N58_06485 [Actinomycetota bacterium]|nr:hypothetical protein [Actinomycetota bacterium]